MAAVERIIAPAIVADEGEAAGEDALVAERAEEFAVAVERACGAGRRPAFMARLCAGGEGVEAFAAAVDAVADRRGLKAPGGVLEMGAADGGRLAQAFPGAPLEAVETVGRAGEAVHEQAGVQAGRHADVARMMGLRVGGQRAAQAGTGRVDLLARLGDERTGARKPSCDLCETRMAPLDAGTERSVETMRDRVQSLPGSAARSSARGRPRSADFRSRRSASRTRRTATVSRSDSLPVSCSRSECFGTAHSAALVGVGARVRHEIDQRPIGFVSDSRDDGNCAFSNGADDGLVVKAPEVFEAAAAARDDQHVGPGNGACRIE